MPNHGTSSLLKHLREREIRGLCEEGEKKFYEKMKGKLGEWLQDKGFTGEKPFLSNAPYLLLVFTDVRAPFAVQSTWLTIGIYFLLLKKKGSE